MRGVWENEKVAPKIKGKEQLNTWTPKEYLRNLCMLGIKIPFWLLQMLLCFIPLKKNRIVMYSLKQHGYSCNLKYLTTYILEHNCQDFELAWIVKNEAESQCLKRRGILAFKLHSIGHWLFRFRAKVVITNDEFYPMFFRRKGQIYVNTWHGGINYKQIGYSGLAFTNRIQKLIYQMNNPQPDIFAAGSQAFIDSTSKAFGFPKSIFLKCGLPRNDIFFQDYSRIAKKVRARLGIPENTKILLYAPTFRRGKTRPPKEPDYQILRDILKQRFGGNWIILCRYHYFSQPDLERQKDNQFILNVSQYEDMQELLVSSDCMISDYSSSMWDFSYTGRPCFVYAPDLKEYQENDRSFSIPVTQWPYPICQNQKELCQAILAFDQNDYQIKIHKHHEQMGSYDHGNACRVLIDEVNVRRRGSVL